MPEMQTLLKAKTATQFERNRRKRSKYAEK